MTPHSRSRLVLALIALLFFASFGAALVLHYGGWRPSSTRNHGELLQPPIDLRALSLRRGDGGDYPWQPRAGVWRVLVAPPEACGTRCLELLDALYRVWLSEGRHADALDVLWVGEPPPAALRFRRLVAIRPVPALATALPDSAAAGALPVYVIDPAGYLVLRYPPGFDPNGLRKDLQRLIR